MLKLIRKPFYYLRHGETDWNVQGLCQGSSDTPLNHTGLAQAVDAKRILSDIPFQTICSSPLDRARKTAEIVSEAQTCTVQEIQALQECYFGSREGKPMIHENLEEFIRKAGHDGGEAYEAFVGRVVGGLNEAVSNPGPVLIVSHGAVFRALVSHIQLTLEMELSNCVPVCLSPSDDHHQGWKLQSV